MDVLWWLAPSAVIAALAMLWAGWAGRRREEPRRDDSDEALTRMRRAIERPAPTLPRRRQSPAPASRPVSHGVVVRRTPGSERPSDVA